MKYKFFTLPRLSDHDEGEYLGKVLVPKHSRTIFYDDKPYFVSFPELIFEILFIKISNNHYETDDEGVAVKTSKGRGIILPNVYSVSDGMVCMGEEDEQITAKSPLRLCKKVIDSFWRSEFNTMLAGEDRIEKIHMQRCFVKALKKGVILVSPNKLSALAIPDKRLTLKELMK